jgi:hypothetical protein
MKASILKKIIQEEVANTLKSMHPWYTSEQGYYDGQGKVPHKTGPKHIGNVSQYLKPNETVYNAKGDSKVIKNINGEHLVFTDGTEDYFMYWFPQKPLDEESASGAAGAYSTPFAFAGNSKKTNKATQNAEKMGFKKVFSGMPKKSKMLDYKELWKGKKSAMNENEDEEEIDYNNIEHLESLLSKLIKFSSKYGKGADSKIEQLRKRIDKLKNKKIDESDYDKASPSSNPSEYLKASDYTKASPSSNPSLYLAELVKEELLNEVTYGKFKNEVKFRTKSEQLHKAIREVKRKIQEIDRIVEYTSRMKQELSEDSNGVPYWKATQKNVATISEMLNHLTNKIKNLQQ